MRRAPADTVIPNARFPPLLLRMFQEPQSIASDVGGDLMAKQIGTVPKYFHTKGSPEPAPIHGTFFPVSFQPVANFSVDVVPEHQRQAQHIFPASGDSVPRTDTRPLGPANPRLLKPSAGV